MSSQSKIKFPAIGIDLGTTFSCVAIYRADSNRVEVIPNEQGNRITPSCVGFQDSERLIGDSAAAQSALNPTNTIFEAKRLIGRRFSDPEVQRDIQTFPFKVICGPNDNPLIVAQYKGETKTFTPEEISSMVLVKMKEIAEAYLGQKIEDAIVTVPAYFNDAQRQATKDAGLIAGLRVHRILNEPTAAALAYGMDTEHLNKPNKERNILVFDLGGGTFDVTLLNLEDGVYQVRAVGGNTHLGGEDFDNRMMRYVMNEFQRRHKVDLSTNPRAIRRIRNACERAKRTLSVQSSTQLEIEALYEGQDFVLPLSRAKFEELNMDLFRSCIGTVSQVILDGKIDKSAVEEIVLVGGSTRIPRIQQLLQEFFNGKALSKSVHPDEAVAVGAAYQIASLAGVYKQDYVLVDVAPLSLGIETAGGLMTVLIEKNSQIPTKKQKIFSTFADNQDSVLIQVYEGERAKTKDNHLLGKFDLSGIPPARRGEPQIQVEFDIDADGVLTVAAKELKINKAASIKITNDKGRLTQDQIKQMLADAEKFKDDDAKARKRIDARNELDGLASHVRSSLSDSNIASKLSDDQKQQLNAALQTTDDFLNSPTEPSLEDYQHEKETLQSKIGPIFSSIYNDSGASGTPPPTGPRGPIVEDVE